MCVTEHTRIESRSVWDNPSNRHIYIIAITIHMHSKSLLYACLKIHFFNCSRTEGRTDLRNEFDFWNVHGIMNTSGSLQSK